MKKLSAYFFLLLMFSFSLHQAVLFGIFVLNQDAIAAKYCVNKDKPEMQCNGKCHLSQMLAQSETQSDDFHVNFQEQVVLPVFYSDLSLKIPGPTLIETCTNYKEFILVAMYTKDYFHPPQVLDFLS